MSAGNQTPAVDSVAPAISRELWDDLKDPKGPPCVVQILEATGRMIRVVDEGDDDYAAEVALAEKEQRERRVRTMLHRRALLNRPRDAATRFAPQIPDLKATPPGWIVKGVIAQKSLVVLYGKHGSGKSTLATDLSVCIVRGMPWHGRKAKQGPVVYIASENAHGSRSRLRAVLKDQGVTLADLGENYLEISGRPHLMKPDEVQQLIKELKPFEPVAIIWDTFARAVAGSDENAVKEMMIAVENAQTIINETGASVILIAHSGKDATRGIRGSSALPAAADTEILVERPDDDVNFRTVRLGKQRDAQDYCHLFGFELQTIELGRDEDGDPITSTVVREVEPPATSRLTVTKLPNSPTRVAIRSVLNEVQRAMPFEEMITGVIPKLAPPDRGTKDRRRDRIKQTAERMVQDRELHIDNNGMVSLLDPAMAFAPVQADANSDLIEGQS